MGKETESLIVSTLAWELLPLKLHKRKMYRDDYYDNYDDYYDSRITYVYTIDGTYLGSVFVDHNKITVRRFRIHMSNTHLNLDLCDPECFNRIKEFLVI